jgi:hypothetical protein
VKLDEAILEELERGEGTVKDISERLSKRLQHALERLCDADRVVRSGYEGKGNLKVYSLPQHVPLDFKKRV